MSPHRDPSVPRRPDSRRAHGFTLVELLVTLVVVGLAVGIAVVNLVSMVKSAELESAAGELTAFLRSVPDFAKETNDDVYCHWRPASGVVTISVDPGGVTELDRLRLPDHLVVTPTADTVYRCDPMGRAYLGTSSQMLSTCPEIRATHTAFANNTFEPSEMFYTLTLTPLWHLETVKHMS